MSHMRPSVHSGDPESQMLYSVFRYDMIPTDDFYEISTRRACLEHACQAMGRDWVLTCLKEEKARLEENDELWDIPFWETSVIDTDLGWAEISLPHDVTVIKAPHSVYKAFLSYYGYIDCEPGALTAMLENANPDFVLKAIIAVNDELHVQDDIDTLTEMLAANTVKCNKFSTGYGNGCVFNEMDDEEMDFVGMMQAIAI